MKKLIILVLVACLLIPVSCAKAPPAPAPAPAPAPTPAPFPTPPQRVPKTNLDVIELNYVRDEWGNGCFLGFVKNVSNSAVEGLRLMLTVYDKAGMLLAQDMAPIGPALRPGEHYPFRIGRRFEPLESYARYKIEVEAYPHRGGGMMLCPELRVISERREEEGRITGTLQNTSDRTAEFVDIVAAGYDKDGKLIAIGHEIGQVSTIPLGISAPFEVVFSPHEALSVTDYEFFISARLKE